MLCLLVTKKKSLMVSSFSEAPNPVQTTCCSHQLWGRNALRNRRQMTPRWPADINATNTTHITKRVGTGCTNELTFSELKKREPERERGRKKSYLLCVSGTNQINESSIMDTQCECVSPYPKYAAVGPGKLRRYTITVNDNHPRSRCPSSILLRLQSRSFRFSWVAV